jgi:hypothetical protein
LDFDCGIYGYCCDEGINAGRYPHETYASTGYDYED